MPLDSGQLQGLIADSKNFVPPSQTVQQPQPEPDKPLWKDLVDTVSNWYEGAKQGNAEVDRRDQQLDSMIVKNPDGTPQVDGNGNVVYEPGITDNDFNYALGQRNKATTTYNNDTTMPVLQFAPPVMAYNLAKQVDDQIGDKSAATQLMLGPATYAYNATFKPAVDIASNLDEFKQKWQQHPAAALAEGTMAALQAAVPLLGAKALVRGEPVKGAIKSEDVAKPVEDQVPQSQPAVMGEPRNPIAEAEAQDYQTVLAPQEIPATIGEIGTPRPIDLGAAEASDRANIETQTPTPQSQLQPIVAKWNDGQLFDTAEQMKGTPASNVMRDELAARGIIPGDIPIGGDDWNIYKDIAREQGLEKQAQDMSSLQDQRQGLADTLNKVGQQKWDEADTNVGSHGGIIFNDKLNFRDDFPQNKLYSGLDPTRGKFDDLSVGDVARNFINQDVKPAINQNAGYIKEAYRDVVDAVNPTAMSDRAQITADKLRQMMGWRANETERLSNQWEGIRKQLNKLTDSENIRNIDMFEEGGMHNDAKINKFMGELHDQFAKRWQELQQLGVAQGDGIQNYLRHLYKDNKGAEDFFRNMPRNLQGTNGFLKPREFVSYKQARVAANLEPVSKNLAELGMLGIRQLDRYIMATRMVKDLETQGIAHRGRVDIPPGYTLVNEHAGGNNLYLPHDAAAVINNYLSPGLQGKGWYQMFRSAGNSMLQARLSLSAFHATFTSGEAVMSHVENGLYKMMHGDILEGAKDVGNGLVNPIGVAVNNFRTGNKLRNELLKPGSEGYRYAELARAAKDAGMRTSQGSEYATQFTDKMISAWNNNNPIGAVLRVPFAGIEQLARPIMEYLVPRQKLGVFAKLAEYDLAKNPYATEAERLRTLQKIQATVDDRLGQMVYDNVFANKTAKDLAQISVQSVGWNGGSWRQIGGGLYDTGKAIKNGVTGSPVDISHRMTYIMALPLVTGFWGSVVTYLMTGHGPQSAKDFFFPPDGGTDKDGRPSRLSLPTYMKDVYHYANNFTETASGKLHPLLGMIYQLSKNKDFYGKEIYHPDDNMFLKGVDTLKHFAQGYEPYSVSGTMKNLGEGKSIGKSVLPLVGLTPAPGDVNKTAAERMMMEYSMSRRPEGSKTQEEADKSDLHRKLIRDVQQNNGNPTQSIQQALQSKQISPQTARELVNMGKLTPSQRSFSPLPMDEAIKVYGTMTDDERSQVSKQMNQKYQNWIKSSSADERARLMPLIQQIKK